MRFRHLMLALLAAVMLLGMMACGQKQEQQAATNEMDEQEQPAFIFFPLPTFKQVFAKLDYVETADYSKALPATYTRVEGNSLKQAYQLGALTADAIFCTKARDDARLDDIAKVMMYYADMLGIQDQINPLTDRLTQLLETKQWDELEVTLEEERQNVVAALHREGEYDIFMLLQVGGWNEALYNLTYLLLDGEFDQATTSILFEIGTLNQLIANYETIPSDRVMEKEFYAVSLEKLKEIREVLLTGQDQTLSRDAVQNIHDKTAEIRAAFE